MENNESEMSTSSSNSSISNSDNESLSSNLDSDGSNSPEVSSLDSMKDQNEFIITRPDCYGCDVDEYSFFNISNDSENFKNWVFSNSKIPPFHNFKNFIRMFNSLNKFTFSRKSKKDCY